MSPGDEHNVDKYALKPVARGYRAVAPVQAQIMLNDAVNNITCVPRFVNSLLQGKWEGALRGIGGLFDPGKVAELSRAGRLGADAQVSTATTANAG